MGKKLKVPEPPKEPPKMPFFLFRDEIYEETAKKYSSLNRGDLAEMLSDKWNKLDK
jgi:hypothetical protein